MTGRAAKVLAALLAATVFVVAGCGGDDEPAPAGGGEAAPETTTVQVGIIPIAPLAPLYLGIEQGFFEEEGLEVEPVTGQGGAAILPAVIAGEQQFGFSNVVSLMLAQQEGLDVSIVANGSQANSEAERGFAAVIVPEDSPIESPEDLAGATIAVNTLNNIGDLTITAALEEQGVDTAGIEFTEIPFPEINAALAGGRVDAAWQEDPFLTQALNDGARIILEHYRAVDPDLPVAAYFTSQQILEDDPELVERFGRAMDRSLQYAQENPEAAREIVLEFTEIPPEVAEEITLAGWSPEINVDGLELLADLGVEQGLFEEPPDVQALVSEEAAG